METINKKVNYLLTLALSVLLISYGVDIFFQSSLLRIFFIGISVGLFIAFFLVRFIILKEEYHKARHEKEKKLQELEEIIKNHEK